MSYQEVKNLETKDNSTPFNESSYLIYRLKIPNIYSARIVYQFEANILVAGRFIFKTQNMLDSSSAIAQYNQVKEMMTKRYGPSITDLSILKDLTSGPPAQTEWPNELASDRLILKSSWQSDAVDIAHQLAWNGSKPHHQLLYTPKALNASSSQDSEQSNAF